MVFWRKRRKTAQQAVQTEAPLSSHTEEAGPSLEENGNAADPQHLQNIENVEAEQSAEEQPPVGNQQRAEEPEETAREAQESGKSAELEETAGEAKESDRSAESEEASGEAQEPAAQAEETGLASEQAGKEKGKGNTNKGEDAAADGEDAADKQDSAKQKKQEEDATQQEAQKTAIMLSNALLREQIRAAMNENPDLQVRSLLKYNEDITLFFLKGAVDEQLIHNEIISVILKAEAAGLTNEALKQSISIARVEETGKMEVICQSLIDGFVFVHVNGKDRGLLYNVAQAQYRSLAQPNNEANVLGPKLEFTESLETNSQIMRQLIKNENLIMESMTIGKRAPKEVRILYMQDLANEENVQTFRERLSQLDVDDILDSSVLIQMIEENEFSMFPQLIMTEQPQRLSYALMSGKVGLLLNGSPMCVIGPVTFFSFFESTEDLYFRWNVSTFLRGLRFLAMFISIIFTPGYVAALTYHYEIIPSALLVSIGQSRANVPFPPVMEALLLEGLIELLREAGARLPTKVGQTIGIVGGIVIGQAAVQAGFTSNILIIVVALSALASFTAPNYVMGTVIRIIRFPLILLAGLAGGIGLMFGLCFLLIHLLKITSLNRPYLAPIYPFHIKDIAQSLIRIPHRFVQERPSYNETPETIRKRIKPKGRKKDIDE